MQIEVQQTKSISIRSFLSTFGQKVSELLTKSCAIDFWMPPEGPFVGEVYPTDADRSPADEDNRAHRPLHPTPCTLHPGPYALHPTPYTQDPTPYTLNPTPCTLHPAPYTILRITQQRQIAVEQTKIIASS